MQRLTDEEIGKRNQAYTLRIPDFLHAQISQLPPYWKKELNNAILVAMAKVVHDANFNPLTYLRDG